MSKQDIEIKNFNELMDIVNSGKSVLLSSVNLSRICYRNEDGSHREEKREYFSKIWQFEKVSDHEYCFKTFSGYEQNIKHYFFMDHTKTDATIEDYYQNFRHLSSIFSHVFCDEKMAKKYITDELLNYRGYSLNFTNQEMFKEYTRRQSKLRKTNSHDNLYGKYCFRVFKTKQTKGSNKSGEETIRSVLNDHISSVYPNGLRHDEYTTLGTKSRADSVVFNKDSIHVYEIKSAKDSFARLEDQIKDYRKYADKITLVLDAEKTSAYMKNHAHKYKDIEVLQYFDHSKVLQKINNGKKLNPTTNKMQLLWTPELKEQALYFISNISQFGNYKLVVVADKIFTKKQAHDIANEILYTRHKTINKDGKMSRGSVDMFKVFYKYKLKSSDLQTKADKIIKELR